MSLCILALRTRDNKLEEVVLELISKAKRFYDGEIEIILPIGKGETAEIIKELEIVGANKIYLVKNDELEIYATNFYQKAVLLALEKITPEILLIGATANGRDLAPRIASALQVGLTADCTELSINAEGKLAATRPTFGGSLMATILSRKIPQMATVRPRVFKKSAVHTDNRAKIVEIPVNLSDVKNEVVELNFVQKTFETTSIEEAEIIVAAGKGVKTLENFKLLQKFAEFIGAKMAASRGLVDMGICKANVQVGQTGKTVTPKIYIACGISGAIQHIEGMKGAKTIIAINKDENAPIFKIADYGIVGDLTEILPILAEKAEGK